MDTNNASGVINHVQKHIVQSQESLYDFFGSGYEKSIYTILPFVEKYPVPSDLNILKFVQFLPSPKIKTFQRSVYNLLDFIGDVGGLLDGLKLIG